MTAENISLLTESSNPDSVNLDKMSPLELVELMHREDFNAVKAVENSLTEIAGFIKDASEALRNGGRLFYLGAGTSGRLGILDASECPPTFGTNPEMVQGIIAGGSRAIVEAAEGAEDDTEAGFIELKRRGFTEKDAVVGITASGNTPFVVGVLEKLKDTGTVTAAVFCNPDSKASKLVKYPICLPVGPEVLRGSTRLKAGTASKLALNMISTGIMVSLGKCIGNMMADMRASNAKLVKRQIMMAASLAGVSEQEASECLKSCGGNLRLALEKLKKD